MKKNEKKSKIGRSSFRQKVKLYRSHWNFLPLSCKPPREACTPAESVTSEKSVTPVDCGSVPQTLPPPAKARVQPYPHNLNRTGILLPVFIILFLNSCQTLPPPWTAPSLTLKVKGATAASKSRIPWTAYIYLKGENDLRLDVVTPLGGTLFRLFARGQKITLQSPLKKSYCQPAFNKYKIWADGPSFSLTNVIHLLRNKIPAEWSCTPSNNSNLCILPERDFKVFLKTQRRKKIIELRKENETKLAFTITPLSGTPLEDKVFSFNVQGWIRLPSCDKEFISL